MMSKPVSAKEDKEHYTLAERDLIKSVAKLLRIKLWKVTLSSTEDPRNKFRPVLPSDLFAESFEMTSCKHGCVEVAGIQKRDKFGREHFSVDECGCDTEMGCDMDNSTDAVFE